MGIAMATHNSDIEVSRPQLSRRQFVALGAASAAAAPSLFAIPGSARAQRGGLRNVKLLSASAATLPLWAVTYLAEDMGFYKEEGLNVERIGLNNGPSAMTALLVGEGTSNFSTPGELLAAKVKGQGTKILMSLTNYSAYVLVVSMQFA